MGGWKRGVGVACVCALLQVSTVVVAQDEPVCAPLEDEDIERDVSAKSCVYSDGSVNLTVNFRVPPTQRQIDHLKEQMHIASEVLCDASDGQISLNEITLTHSEGWQEEADIWWYPLSGRAYASGGIGKGTSHVAQFGYIYEGNPCPPPCDSTIPAGMPGSCDPDGDGNADGCDRSAGRGSLFHCFNCGSAWQRTGGTNLRGDVLAHELGHYLFEVGDQYAEQNRANAGGCGIGPGFDGDDASWKLRDAPVAMSAAERAMASTEEDVERNHTIMQGSGGQVCRDTTQSDFSYFEMHPDLAGRGWYRCHDDADCQLASNGGYGLGSDWACVAVPPVASELSVDGNQDPMLGSSFDDPNDVMSCSDAYNTTFPSEQLVLSGRVRETANPACGNFFTSTGLGEQCDPPGRVQSCTSLNASLGTNFTGGNASCHTSCLWDLSACTRPVPQDSCTANSTPDPGEQCQAGDSETCVNIKGMGTGDGSASCGGNCAWDLASCVAPDFRCGDGVRNDPLFGAGGEQCDGSDLDGLACVDFGFDGGTLGCMSNCYFDFSACTRAPVSAPDCGNGMLEASEDCDPSAGGSLPSCADFGAPRGGNVACDATNCTYDVSACEPNEWQLDATTLTTANRSPGFHVAGTRAFDGEGQTSEEESMHFVWVHSARHSDPNAWTFAVSIDREEYASFDAYCGNGAVDADVGEECEPGDTQACTSFSSSLWQSGDAVCDGCVWDKSACQLAMGHMCGDGTNGPDEECDGPSARRCWQEGLAGHDRPLACNPNCSLDRSSCTLETFQPIARYHVVFDPASGEVTTINGVAHPTQRPSIVLGSNGSRAYGSLPDGSNGGQTMATGPFAEAGHPEVELELRFEDLRQASQVPDPRASGSVAQRIFLHTRHDVLADGRDVPERGLCDQDLRCRLSWNRESERFEMSHDTFGQIRAALNGGATMDQVLGNRVAFIDGEWTRLEETMTGTWMIEGFDGYSGTERPLAGLAMGRTCTTPTFTEVDLDTPTQAVLVLDRSGSMKQEDAGGLGDGLRRLDFAKAAAKVFVDLFADPNRPAADYPELGLVWFNHEQEVAFGEPGKLRKLVRGDCGDSGNACPDANEIGHEHIKEAFLREEEHPNGENPEPEGNTSIGAAVEAAGELFGDPKGQTQAIVLLTDGENNPPFGEVDDARGSAEMVAEEGVRFYTVPAGDADIVLNSQLARMSGGAMLPVDETDQLPPRFMGSFAKTRGEALSVDRAAVEVRQPCPPAAEFCSDDPAVPAQQTITLPVEVGAQRLNVLLSSRDGNPGNTGLSGFELRDPEGTVVRTHQSPDVRNDRFYRMVSVLAPMAGDWQLDVQGSSVGSSQHAFVTAHAENPMPDCFVKATPSVLQDTGELEVYATALWNRQVRDGVSFTGTIVQPDKSEITLDFQWDEFELAYIARLPATDLTAGAGGYEIRVACDVSESAALLEGEDPYDEMATVPDDAVEAFHREASTSFYFDTTEPTALKPGDDADGDGILNDDEPTGDFDDDGLDDVWDSDADNDDVPDDIDPDPRDPDIPYAGGGECQSDTNAPVISASDLQLLRAVPATREVDLGVSVTDDSCLTPEHVDFTGRIVSINGRALSYDVTVDGHDPRVALPVGTTEIAWTASDIHGNTSTADQTVTIQLDESPATLCDAGMTVVEGWDLPDVFVFPQTGRFCVLGKGGIDTLITGLGADVLSGGSGLDVLVTGSADDVVLGGGGSDIMTLPVGDGYAYGGEGHDVIEVTGAGVLHGNAGNDEIIGVLGSHHIYPGPGRDVVVAGPGDDAVYIHDTCELEPAEVLEGGSGYDTLHTPVPVTQLNALGVVVLGFEQIVVDGGNAHLAECF